MAGDYDVLVLGAGNAGLAAAGAAHAAGHRVLVVEAEDVGGVCPLRGCVPKKVLVAAAQALDGIARAGAHGIAVGPATLDWKALIERTRSFVEGVPAAFERSLAERGIERVRGRARFTGAHEITVGAARYRARQIVVATGSTPRALPIPGAEHLVTSDDLLTQSELAESYVFVGAGVIALEFAHVLARAGAKVTLLEVAPRVLPALDADASAVLAEATRALGVAIETGVTIERIEAQRSALAIHYRGARGSAGVCAERAVNGAGRVADLAGLDLAAAGITLSRGQIAIDAHLRSVENPDVFFAGDAIPGRPQLSPLATYEGRIVGYNLTHETLRVAEYGFQPAVVHTLPALATVGLDEVAAREAGLVFEVHVNDMRSWRSARTYAETTAWAKVLVETGSDRILGAHLVGHGAEETIHTLALAIEKGTPAREIADRTYAYPTFHSDLRFLLG